MAQTFVMTITDQWSDGKRLHVIGTATPTGSYATPGPTLDFGAAGVESSGLPEAVFFTGKNTGTHLTYVAGANQTAGTVRFWEGVTEKPDEAFDAGQLAEVFTVYAIFKALI